MKETCISLYDIAEIITLNPISEYYRQMHTLANSENPDEMLHNAAFHQGLHTLFAKIKRISQK